MSNAFVVAARRTAHGRIGGLHRSRSAAALAGPVIAAALADAGIAPADVDELIVGCSSGGDGTARHIALAAGLPDATPALILDRSAASALDAVRFASRLIAAGDAEVVVAGGVDAYSMAPWRIARPRNGALVPRFMSPVADPRQGEGAAAHIEAAEAQARQFGIGRAEQDAEVLGSMARAQSAAAERAFLREIVLLRQNAEETADQLRADDDDETLAEHAPLCGPKGSLTEGNICRPADGAGTVVLVSEAVLKRLGAPRCLRLAASSVVAVAPGETAQAGLKAIEALRSRNAEGVRRGLSALELSETSAAEVLAVMRELEIGNSAVNPGGGTLARGHTGAGEGGTLLARLFTRLVRAPSQSQLAHGIVCAGTSDGMATALLLEVHG